MSVKKNVILAVSMICVSGMLLSGCKKDKAEGDVASAQLQTEFGGAKLSNQERTALASTEGENYLKNKYPSRSFTTTQISSFDNNNQRVNIRFQDEVNASKAYDMRIDLISTPDGDRYIFSDNFYTALPIDLNKEITDWLTDSGLEPAAVKAEFVPVLMNESINEKTKAKDIVNGTVRPYLNVTVDFDAGAYLEDSWSTTANMVAAKFGNNGMNGNITIRFVNPEDQANTKSFTTTVGTNVYEMPDDMPEDADANN